MSSRTRVPFSAVALLLFVSGSAVLESNPAAAAAPDALTTTRHDEASAIAAGRQAGPQQPNRRVTTAGEAYTSPSGPVYAREQAQITFRVFATQYEPNTPGSVEVAVPDKCVKFASLRNTSALNQFGCPSGYSLSLDYRVDIRRDNGQTGRFQVKDVGPWNLDDNYWNPPSGTARPRRLFTDLPLGTPEAQAAFYQGYNTVPNCNTLGGTPSGRAGGADQFGRCVLNPAGIDLSIAAAAQLGLGRGQNDWVDVTFRWEAPPGTLTDDPDDVQGPRIGVINGCSGGYVKGGTLSSAFRQQLNCGDARVLSLGGNRVGVINGCGAGYVKEGALSGPFVAMVGCNDARAITVSPNRVGVINGCGAGYVKEGVLSAPFRLQLNCGDALQISLGGGTVGAPSRMGVINACAGAYVKEGSLDGPFIQQLRCGDARQIVVTENRIGVISGCGAFYVKEGGLGSPFHIQTGCNDARSIALSGNRIAVINGCGALFVKEGSLGSAFRQQTGCNDAQATSLAGTRVGVINGCGAAYVKEGSLTSAFSLQLNCGDARALSLAAY